MSVLIMAACCASAMQAQTVEEFVGGMLQQYPKARLLDIYKSCFQDFMGAEHLVNDTESARGYLNHELSTIEVDDLLPWYYEPCGIHGRYVRVSLRAVIEGKIGPDALLDAFVRSANDPERPTVEQWAAQWQQYLEAIEHMEITLPHCEEDKEFIDQVLSQGRYAISHSPEYRDAYAPHYRIIRRDIFEQELLPLLTCDN